MVMRLKKKDELNYRRVKAISRDKCKTCVNFYQAKIVGIAGADIGVQARCLIMGAGASIRYRIHPLCVCDQYERVGQSDDELMEDFRNGFTQASNK